MLKKFLILPVLALTLAGCSNSLVNNSDQKAPVATTNKIEEKTVAVENNSTAEINEEKPQYISFTQEKYQELLGEKPFAIFFHAGWCPSCVDADKKIKQDLANSTPRFPKGTIILKADYDTETELKKTYGIVMQSTHVIIDKEGNVTAKLAEPSIDEYAQKITASL
ncbi:hypothetical protein COU74_02960 [Candidatus Peregrinibacteria bacterium CG10_big_fil_rev_8_21_14_0_10_36_19]|nr:MAG: hypothetical protein COU74_02960 [Candidatus Peregrinibacteria bacterium CG10_big_fil_rev_8_21_14_0_10_36_19]